MIVRDCSLFRRWIVRECGCQDLLYRVAYSRTLGLVSNLHNRQRQLFPSFHLTTFLDFHASLFNANLPDGSLSLLNHTDVTTVSITIQTSIV